MSDIQPFWNGPLTTLQQISRDPIPPIEELKRLRKQIDVAIDLIEHNEIIPMTAQELREHANRFGRGSFVVGNYVIRRTQ